MTQRILTWPRYIKQLTVVALDVVLALLATWLAFGLRLDVWGSPVAAQWWVYFLAPLLAIPIFVRFGLYRAIFRYTGQAALNATAKAVVLYSALLTVILLSQHWQGVPRTLGVLQPIIFLILVGLSRAMARFWLAGLPLLGSGEVGSRLLIYGAGNAGAQTASALQLSGQFKLVGFVDDSASMVGRIINGTPIFGAEQIPNLVSRHRVTDIFLAMPNATRERRNQIIRSLESLPVHVRSLPSMSDLTSGKVTVQDFRELDIEDLLGREPVPPNAELLARDLAGQVVLVSGAGGSIGSELTRQIILQKPRQLLLLDHNEFGLYTIHQELLALCAHNALRVELIPVLASISNAERLQAVFSAYRPVTVYHAAAYKHVPMVEDNPGEGVRNNVFGTLNVAKAAVASGVHRFVLISTDKAVRPTNVMGATKRMAELVLQAFAQAHPQTLFSMVRFGNVLGSSGSVVPLFRKQLAEGGPLTVTHPEVTRYFMTIPEAAQLVLQAGAMGTGGDVFVLDMGQPIKIIDLARRMLHLSGLSERSAANPNGDIAIAITGLRPGEKLYEELLIGDNPEPTEHPRIMKAHEPHLPWDQLQPVFSTLLVAADQNNVSAIKAVFLQHVQGYSSE
jgi:FlaA1/EpsC-like NDP-sugar epimerase